MLFKQRGRDLELLGIRFYIVVSDGRTLLHDIAQLSCNQKISFSFGQLALYKENLAARPGPCQSCHYSGDPFLQLFLMLQLFLSKIVCQIRRGHDQFFAFFFHQFHRRGTAKRIQMLLQAPDSGFHRVFIDDLL